MMRNSLFSRSLLGSALAILALGIARPPYAEANRNPAGVAYSYAPYSYATNPCTAAESWRFSRAIPRSWQGRFMHPFDSEKNTLDLLLLSDILKNSTERAEAREFAEYWFWRSLYELRLYHVAFEGFASLLEQTGSGLTGIRLAALGCMNRIEGRYPSIPFPSSALMGLRSIPLKSLRATERTKVWEAAVASAHAELARGDSEPMMAAELRLLQGSGAYALFMQGLIASAQKSDLQTIRAFEALLKQGPLPQALKKFEDRIYLLLGRAYYDSQQYNQAFHAFAKVRAESGAFPDALQDLAWTHLMRGNYADAIGKAQNFLVGGFKHLFAPDAHYIAAIVLNETCNYPQGIETTEHFRKAYDKTWRWLTAWKADREAKARDLYSLVVKYLKKEVRVPDPIITTWLGSTVFTMNQDELNELLSERAHLNALPGRLSQQIATKSDRRWQASVRRIDLLAKTSLTESKNRESLLVREINADLIARSNSMHEALRTAFDDIALVDSELYSALAERVAVAGALGRPKDTGTRTTSTDKSADAVYDWGRFPTSGDESPEIWEDELGFLKTDITNKCQEK